MCVLSPAALQLVGEEELARRWSSVHSHVGYGVCLTPVTRVVHVMVYILFYEAKFA